MISQVGLTASKRRMDVEEESTSDLFFERTLLWLDVLEMFSSILQTFDCTVGYCTVLGLNLSRFSLSFKH
jgi:hypothetical protein